MEMMATMVEHRGRKGPIKGPHKSLPPSAVEDFAEEVINGIFCHYESADERSSYKARGILRPPNSFQRERTNESNKSVRWIDDEGPLDSPSNEPDNKNKTRKNKASSSRRSGPLNAALGTITHSCIEAGVESGCMSPTQAKSGLGKQDEGLEGLDSLVDLQPSMSQDSNVSFQRESRAQRYAVFDDEGNPKSTKPGMKEPPKPPPTPPPSKKEIFIPQLCGVELNILEDPEELYKNAMARYGHVDDDEEEDDDNSLMMENEQVPKQIGITTAPPPPVALKKTLSGRGTSALTSNTLANPKASAKISSWEEPQARLEASHEENEGDDWDGPDWMEDGQRTDSKDELEKHGRYSMMDPVAMNRSDIGAPQIEEDDWDNSLAIIPGKRPNTLGRSGSSASSTKPETVQEESAGDENEEEDETTGDVNKQEQDKKDLKKRLSLFGRRKSQGRDPSPGRSLRRNSLGRGSDVSGTLSEALAQSNTNSANKPESSDGNKKETDQSGDDWKQRSASLKEKIRRNSRSNSRSPGRRLSNTGKKILNGITTFSPTRATEGEKNNQGFDSTTKRDNAPMPHLHPAHPLNQVRQKLQERDEAPDRQSYIGAYRSKFDKNSETQTDQDDRMSFITAHRKHVDGERRSDVETDQDDKMSFITAHRKHVDGDKRSQAASDFDERISYITAYRTQAEGGTLSPPPPPPPPPMVKNNDQRTQDVGENVEKQSFIGAHREMMDSTKRRFRIPSPSKFRSGLPAKSLETRKELEQQNPNKDIERTETVTTAPTELTAESLGETKTVETNKQPQTTTKKPAVPGKIDGTESSKEFEKKEEEISWEERTRLAWERIRNPFGFGEAEKSENEGAKPQLDETKAMAEHVTDAGQQKDQENLQGVSRSTSQASQDEKSSGMKVDTCCDFLQASNTENSQQSLKSILKTPPAKKNVTFMESLEKMLTTATIADADADTVGETDVDMDENVPPTDDEVSEGPVDTDSFVAEPVDQENDTSESLAVEKETVVQPLQQTQTQTQSGSPNQKKKKKSVFRGRKIFASIRGKGKGKNSKKKQEETESAKQNNQLPFQDSGNIQAVDQVPREDIKTSAANIAAPTSIHDNNQTFQDQSIPTTTTQNSSVELSQTATGESHEEKQFDTSNPQPHAYEQPGQSNMNYVPQVGENGPVPMPMYNPNQQAYAGFMPPVPLQQYPNGFMYPMYPYPHGGMIDPVGAGEHIVDPPDDDPKPRRSFLGRGRDRSRSPGRRRENSRSLSPGQRAANSNAPQPILHPYQQGYIYSHQPYAFMNPPSQQPNGYSAGGPQPPQPYLYANPHFAMQQHQSNGYAHQMMYQNPAGYNLNGAELQNPAEHNTVNLAEAQNKHQPLPSTDGDKIAAEEKEQNEPGGILSALTAGMF